MIVVRMSRRIFIPTEFTRMLVTTVIHFMLPRFQFFLLFGMNILDVVLIEHTNGSSIQFDILQYFLGRGNRFFELINDE